MSLELDHVSLNLQVNRQPSRPDDIAINMLLQHLSGKGPRNYPQV